MTVFRASYWILLCNCGLQTVFLFCEARGSPSGIFLYIIHFVDTQFRENLSVFHWHQNYGFCRDREMKSFYFSPKWRSSLLPIKFFCVTGGFQRSSYCVKTVEIRLAFCFNIIHFVDTQFRENLRVFPWHQNYGFCRDREMKTFYFSPKWLSSGLPYEFFCVTAGFQRSPYCVKTVEVRVAFFLCNTFCRYSVSRNLSVFPWHQNYGFCKDREMKSFYFSPKWRSSGFLLNSFV